MYFYVRQYFANEMAMLYPSWGLRDGQIAAAIAVNLSEGLPNGGCTLTYKGTGDYAKAVGKGIYILSFTIGQKTGIRKLIL